METRQLIEKVNANRAYYVTYASQCLNELVKKYKVEPYHRAGVWIIYNINQKTLNKICKKYGCSGFMAGDEIMKYLIQISNESKQYDKRRTL